MNIHPACRRTAIAVIASIATVALCACSDSSGPSATPSTGATTTPTEQASRGPVGTDGPSGAITSADANATLPFLADETHSWGPIAGWGDQIVVAKTPNKGPESQTTPWTYWLWLPLTGEFRELWTDPAGQQTSAADMDGPWFVGVRRGFGGTGAYAEWTIFLRNVDTGEQRAIGEAPPGAAEDTTPVKGSDPAPSISGGNVVWSESSQGVSRVQLYDIMTKATTTIMEATAPEYVWSASTGATLVTWLHSDGATTEIVAHSLTGGSGRTYPVGADAVGARINKLGEFVAWDEGTGGYRKYIFDLFSGEGSLVAEGQGFGTYVSGGYASWDTATGQASTVYPSGLYDVAGGELRLLDTGDSLTNVGHVMGDWFVWQDVPFVDGNYDYAQGHWYGMHLAPEPVAINP